MFKRYLESFVILLGVLSVCSLLSCSKPNGSNAVSDWEKMGGDDTPDPEVVPEEPTDNHYFKTRGLVMGWSDVCNRNVLDYIKLAKDYELNTFSIYNADRNGAAWKKFAEECAENGIKLEYEEHMLSFLIPRDLFTTHPEYFRMNEQGARVNDANGCPSCEEAIKLVKSKAKEIARNYVPTNDKYYFWLDDGGGICHCPKCKDLNAADQALIFENAIVEAVREINPKAMVAHLCYYNTKDAPKTIKPAEGIFLEFAPLGRSYDGPLANSWVKGSEGYTHSEYLRFLSENLKVFPKETAQVLEYWLDESMFCGWNPDKLVKIPWNEKLFLSDIKTYASYGIKHVMSYAAYVSPAYVAKFNDVQCLEDYAKGLRDFTK